MVDEIVISQLGKRFNGRWIFRHLNHQWKKGDRVAIIGSNGSGKSSLTSMIAGFLTPTEGAVVFKNNSSTLSNEDHWLNISWTAPSLMLPEQFSYLALFEQINRMRSFHADWSLQRMETIMGLEKYRDQPLKFFSSGMRQRVKLVLAFAIQSDVLILDEPTAHLDKGGVAWFAELIKQANHNFIFVASNSNSDETFFCNKVLDVTACVQGAKDH